MANIAFGTQKISIHNLQHIQALKEAISSGVTLIESSLEFSDATSLQAIALAFRELDESFIEDVEVVVKFSYKEQEGIEEQLNNALSDLEVKKIDCFMVHKIEYYLLDALEKKIEKDERLDGISKIIYKVFYQLEQSVQDNKIKTYGISSAFFAHNQNLDTFLPYEDLVTIAEIAAKEVGNKKHSFTTIEFPLNILEQNGLKCASWAKENGLRVLTMRPLSAFYNNKFYRLASYDESINYYHYFNELLEISDNELLKPLYNLIDELDNSKHKFGWVEDYDQFLFQEVMPHILNALKKLDQEYQETLVNYIDMFLSEYRKMVLFECSKKTKEELKDIFNECLLPLQECALDFLLQQQDIDFVVVGMRKSFYVSELLR